MHEQRDFLSIEGWFEDLRQPPLTGNLLKILGKSLLFLSVFRYPPHWCQAALDYDVNDSTSPPFS
jgi:hypothetical protein